jgi:very-short-patch-repair endonuclease
MICQECGKELKAINSSHLRKHGMTLGDYRIKYPDSESGQKYTPLTKEQREKLKMKAKGRVKSEAEKRKIGLKRRGQVHSEETKRKMSETRRGRPAWNKGMKGIFTHSEEYKERMRIQQCHLLSQREKGKATSIEIKIRGLLESLGLKFEEQKVLHNKFTVDFYLPEVDLVIECNGDYWHEREDVKIRDRRKIGYLTKCGHHILILWESEINEDIEMCREEILNAYQRGKKDCI